MRNNNAGLTFTVGNLLAGLLSWTTNHDVIWCIIHAILSWFYVIYWAIFYWK